MEEVIKVNFNGSVFYPEVPINLEANKSYLIKIIGQEDEQEKEQDAWNVLEELIGTCEAPEDWSKEHDYYLYGTAKKLN